MRPVPNGIYAGEHIHLGAAETPPTLNTLVSRNSDAVDEQTVEHATGRNLLFDGLVIVDDCTLFREILADILPLRGVPVASTAWDLPSLIAAFEHAEASLVLLNMATRSSHLLIRTAKDIKPGVRIIVVGIPEDDEQRIIACAEAGVAGYHLRRDSLDDLINVIVDVASGQSTCPPWVSAILLRRLSTLASQPQLVERDLVLTTREAQILKMLELGRSNRDIAMRLNIAVHTVKNHVHNLFTKLGVSTRAEAAARSHAILTERNARRD